MVSFAPGVATSPGQAVSCTVAATSWLFSIACATSVIGPVVSGRKNETPSISLVPPTRIGFATAVRCAASVRVSVTCDTCVS